MIKKIFYLLACFVIVLAPASSYAWKESDKKAIQYDTVYKEDATCTASSGGGGGVSNLPGSVPSSLAPTFTEAANKYNVDVALIAAIYWQEHGGNFIQPPPPYGNGDRYASSNKGASGPFQFIPGTWAAFGVDANGDGNTDVQDLKDASYAAAKYLKELGATADVPAGSTEDFKQKGTAVNIMASYNWGPGNVDNAASFANFPAETSNYVIRGGRTFRALKGGDSGAPVTPVDVPDNESSCSSDSGDSAAGGSILEVARAELAKNVAESPPGSNGGGRISVYTDNNREPWCADFVSWVYKTAGKPFTGGASGGWRIPSVNTLDMWLKENGTRVENKSGAPAPQPGDVVIFDHSGDEVGNDTHTGIIEQVSGNKMITIEGNTSDKVARRTYDNYRSNNTIRSWGRPR